MTTDRECPCGIEAVRDQAALWFARSRDNDLPAGQRADFETWLAEHDQHAHEFRLLQNLWGAADLLPRARLEALLEPDAPTPLKAPPSNARRTFVRYAVAASLMVAVVGSGFYFGLDRGPEYSAEFATVLGERRQVALPDGSVIDLNGRTRLNVHFYDASRQVELVEGEAMFSVQHDTSKPFVVQTGNGSVTVTGTRFDVRRDPTRTLVAVESGTVKVKGKADEQGNRVTLTAGLGSSIDVSGKVTPASAVNTAAITAWRGGKLVFNDASLRDVALEVSRYREKPLRVAEGKTANLRLTSVFKSDDTDALLRALPSILPVAVRTLPDGSQEIFSR
ncbi:FecR family protein [Pseudomonas sp. NPDC088444]|uniref:FecR family protein n=1 Tax=Pseudomonas sp. NPDC088444 TaxID=3364456 RepID=UPI00384B9FFF